MAINKRLINTGGGGVEVPTSFNTVTYTGNGSTHSITGVGFQPDLVWIKSRSAATSHKLTDVVRGTTKGLVSNTTAAETTDTNGLTAFGSDGFTLGSDSVYNTNTSTYVAWCWKAGGAAVTNTDGSISSEVSANVDAGFSVVKYVGDGNGNSTVGHGLSQVPDLYITKDINNTGNDTTWGVYFVPLNYKLFLSSTIAASDGTAAGSNGGMGTNKATSTTLGFNAGSSSTNNINNDGTNYLVYVFHSVAGFSKFGSYTGTGAAGNVVTVGFEPAFVMLKATSISGASWTMYDNKRGVGEPSKVLYANLSAAEYSDNFHDISFSATGFTCLDNSNNTNQSGQTYIYMAFANQF